MKYWIPVAIAALAFVVASCDGGVDPPGPVVPAYVGIWVNPAHNGQGGGPPGKIDLEEDAVAFYDNDTDETPVLTGSFDLEETSGGGRFFKGILETGSSPVYWIMRVGNHDATLESDFSDTAYPTSMNPGDNNYDCFTRQGTEPPEVGLIFYGAWANSDYNGGHGTAGPPGKFAMSADSFASYDYDYDEVPMSSGSLSLADDWTSEGCHYFTGDVTITAGTGAGTHSYFLMRVSNSNDTMEMGTSDTDYPTSVGITYTRP